MKRSFVPLFCLSAVLAGPLFAQTVTQTPVTDGEGANAKITAVMPANLFAPAKPTRSLKIGIYFGPGSPEKSSQSLVVAAGKLKGTEIIGLAPADYATKDLSQFDILVFAGGSGSGQAQAIGEEGRSKIRKFVHDGGGYLGICAGAYLATSGYHWSLGLYNAKTIQPWLRGGGAVALQLTDDGKSVLGNVNDTFPVRYHNGPIIKPDTKTDLPAYTVIAYFRNEITKQPEQVGQMTDTPAIVTAQYFAGRVVTISPHFEQTTNADNIIPRLLAYIAEKPAP